MRPIYMVSLLIPVLLAAVLLACAARGAKARAAAAAAPKYASIYDVPVAPRTADTASSNTLGVYRGKALLIVNVASKRGFTPQYEGLERIYSKYKDRGLVVLGFPANDFLNQEPGTEEEIVTFCKLNYGVSFPIYGKLHVKGKEQSPLYAWLTGPASPFPGSVKWNFEKFLIGPDGKVLARFRTPTKPESAAVVGAIEKALKKTDE